MSPEDTRAVRAASKGSGWVARAGTLSRRSADNALHVYEFAGWLQFRAKPFVWDEIFWDVMGIGFSRTPSPTRHFWGHSCLVPSTASAELTGSTPQERARRILSFAETTAGLCLDAPLTVAGLMQRAIYKGRETDYVELEVVEHLAAKDLKAARKICNDVLNKVRPVSFSHNIVHDGESFSFFQRALTWTPA